ncbi:MAG TPA: hypothetical protein VEQ42_05830, partial [Pyrinomonadaceae bacterium]|nr:hypothetical protein [Pyrinomonadaceae bacterium]
MKQSGIARRLLLWFLILGLLPMTVLAAVVYNESRQALIKAQKEKLRAIADYNTNRLERWARERMRSVTNLARLTASMSALKTFTETFDSAPRGEEYAQSGAYQQAKEAKADIINHLDFIAYQYKYQNIYFISMKGDIVAAVKPHPALGTNLQDGPYGDTELAKVFRRLSQKTWPAESKDAWIEGEISDFRPFGPSAPDRSAFVVAPVRDCANNSECNAPYGFLAVQMPHTAIAQAALDNIGMSSPNDDSAGRAYSGLGRTGEVIIGSREGNRIVFVAAMRHDQRAAFERYINVGDESMKGLQEVLGKGSGTGELVAGDESVKNLEGDEGKRDKETWAG